MRWKPLLAVLLGLLMVGVTARSASARPVSNGKVGPITTQNFGDKDQLEIYFSKYDSYVYGGKIWLAFVWHWDGYTELGDGTKDPIRIMVPWIIEYEDGTLERILKEEPSVYVKLNEFYYNPEKDIEIKPTEVLAKWADFKFPDGHIERIKIHYKVIRVDVDDDISFGMVYIGVRPTDKWKGSEFNMPMLYLHTWNQWTLISAGLTLTFSILSPTPQGRLANAGVGLLTFVASELFHDFLENRGWGIGSWEEPKVTNPTVKLSYSEYPYKRYPPTPPCVEGICPTSGGGGSEALRG